ARTVVAPAVPTVAITAVSKSAPVSIMIVWPASKPATLATLMLVAPLPEGVDRMVAACNRKSLQLLSLSTPSGKRPALVLVPPAAANSPKSPTEPGTGTKQPLCPSPEAAWYPSAAHGSTSAP